MEDKEKTHWGNTEFGDNAGFALIIFAAFLGFALICAALGWGINKSEECQQPLAQRHRGL